MICRWPQCEYHCAERLRSGLVVGFIDGTCMLYQHTAVSLGIHVAFSSVFSSDNLAFSYPRGSPTRRIPHPTWPIQSGRGRVCMHDPELKCSVQTNHEGQEPLQHQVSTGSGSQWPSLEWFLSPCVSLGPGELKLLPGAVCSSASSWHYHGHSVSARTPCPHLCWCFLKEAAHMRGERL